MINLPIELNDSSKGIGSLPIPRNRIRYTTDKAVIFDGVDEYIKIKDNVIDVGTSDFTIGFFIKCGAQSGYNCPFSCRDDGGATYKGFQTWINQDGIFGLQLGDGVTTAYTDTSNGFNLSDNNWHFISGIFDRDSAMFRNVDGISYGSDKLIDIQNNASVINGGLIAAQYFADMITPSGNFDGILAHIWLIKKFLNHQQLSDYYNSGSMDVTKMSWWDDSLGVYFPIGNVSTDDTGAGGSITEVVNGSKSTPINMESEDIVSI